MKEYRDLVKNKTVNCYASSVHVNSNTNPGTKCRGCKTSLDSNLL